MSAVTQQQQVALPGDLSGIDGAARILDCVLLDAGQVSDRGLIRRVVREAQAAFPGETAENWWRWLAEAARLAREFIDQNL